MYKNKLKTTNYSIYRHLIYTVILQ